MALITTIGPYGLVLDSEYGAGQRTSAKSSKPISADRILEHPGHLVLLNRYKVDDDGYICLTPSMPLRDLYGSVELVATELRCLLEQAQGKVSSDDADEMVPTGRISAV